MSARILNILLIAAAALAVMLGALSSAMVTEVSVPVGMRARVFAYSASGLLTLGFNHAQRQPTVALQYFIKSPRALEAHNKRQRDRNLPVVDHEALHAFSIARAPERLPDGSERRVWSLSLPWWFVVVALGAYPCYRGVVYLRIPRCRNCRADLRGVEERECPGCAYPIPPAVRQRIAALAKA